MLMHKNAMTIQPTEESWTERGPLFDRDSRSPVIEIQSATDVTPNFFGGLAIVHYGGVRKETCGGYRSPLMVQAKVNSINRKYSRQMFFEMQFPLSFKFLSRYIIAEIIHLVAFRAKVTQAHHSFIPLTHRLFQIFTYQSSHSAVTRSTLTSRRELTWNQMALLNKCIFTLLHCER